MKDDDKQKTAAQLDAEASSVYAINEHDKQLRGPVAIAEHEAHLTGGERNDPTNPLYGEALDQVQGTPNSDLEHYEDAMRDKAHVDPKYLNPQTSGTVDRGEVATGSVSLNSGGPVGMQAAAEEATEAVDGPKKEPAGMAGMESADLQSAIGAVAGIFGSAKAKDDKKAMMGDAGSDDILSPNKPSLFGAKNPAHMAKMAQRDVPPKDWDPAKDKK